MKIDSAMLGLNRATLVFVLLLILSSAVVLVSEFETVRADGAIYIRVNGSVDGTDKIHQVGDIYTFTRNIMGSIVVEKDDIMIDGACYMLEGSGNGTGILLSHRRNVTIQNMQIKAFYYGIWLNSSSNNRIYGNNVTNNRYGISINFSSNSTIRNNHLTSNSYNFCVEANLKSGTSNFINDVDTSNTVDGKPIYYWVNQQDKTMPSDAGYIALINCTHIMIKNLHLTNNGQGILLASTTNSVITKNVITGNVRGIRFYSSSNNTVCENNITENSISGIGLETNSNLNNIYGNTIKNNSRYGIWLFDSSNHNSVNKNNITNSLYGILLPSFSNFNHVCENRITNNDLGVWLDSSSNNTIHRNTIASNGDGLWLYSCSNFNDISENNITSNKYGLLVYNSSSFNSIYSNNMNDNELGIWFFESSSNQLFHNNFNNSQQVLSENSKNLWDDGCPSGGNYWSDYLTRHADAKEISNLGIGDIPYVIDENNQDIYPLINQWIPNTQRMEGFPTMWIPTLIGTAFIICVALIIYLRKRKQTTCQETL